jgi:hypothetical protein
MCRVLVSLLLFPLLACDQTYAQFDARTDAQFDARLSEMAGANERQLLGAMGRIPDNSYRLDDQTKVLQWVWDTSYISPSYISPSCSPRRGFGGYSPRLVRESCLVEWTVTKGTSQRYHWVGYGCRSVTLMSSPAP